LVYFLCQGGGQGGDREVTINVKRGVEAKNYADVRKYFIIHIVLCESRLQFCKSLLVNNLKLGYGINII